MATIRDKYILDVDVRNGVNNLKKLGDAGEKTKQRFLNVKTAVAGAVTAIGTIGVGSLVKNVAEVTARTQDLKTALETVTGSAQGANDAFGFIQDFATTTPFDIDTLTETFIKLKASGIEPTKELLTAFGDAASVSTDKIGAMEAAADLFSRSASGGLGLEDLNRLADRGIAVFPILEEKLGLARLEVSEYGKTAEGAAKIQQALVEGFQEEFGGGMERSVGNISTQLSNMGIAADNALLAIGEGGLTEGISTATGAITEMLSGNDELLESLGALLGDVLSALPVALEGVREAFAALEPVLTPLGELFGALFDLLKALAPVFQLILDVVTPLAEMLRDGLAGAIELVIAVVERVTAVVETFVAGLENIAAKVRSLKSEVSSGFSDMADSATESAKDFYNGVTGWFGATEDEVVGNSIVPDMVNGVLGEFDKMNLGMNRSLKDSTSDSLNQFRAIARAAREVGNEIGIGDFINPLLDTVIGSRTPSFAGGNFPLVGDSPEQIINQPLDRAPFQGTTVQMNINAVDAPSFRNLVARDPQFIASVAQKGLRTVPFRR